jgi:hypothetical protein
LVTYHHVIEKVDTKTAGTFVRHKQKVANTISPYVENMTVNNVNFIKQLRCDATTQALLYILSLELMWNDAHTRVMGMNQNGNKYNRI